MSFIENTLNARRPSHIKEVDLPRRQQYHPSPGNWRNEILYFLLVDRFSDIRENERSLLDEIIYPLPEHRTSVGTNGLSREENVGKVELYGVFLQNSII